MTKVPNDGLIHLRGFRNPDHLLITNPKALAEVLVTKPYAFQKGPRERALLRRVLGDGLIVVEGDLHKFQRKRLQPSFGFGNIHRLYPTFWSKSVSLTDQMKAQILEDRALDDPSSGVVDIDYWAPKVTLDIIGIAGLGRDFNTLQNSDDELARLYEEIMAPSREKLILILLNACIPQSLLKALHLKIDKRLDDLTNRLRAICEHFVREKRQTNTGESFDVLAQLIRLNEFSDGELVQQMLTFLAAGYVTVVSIR